MFIFLGGHLRPIQLTLWCLPVCTKGRVVSIQHLLYERSALRTSLVRYFSCMTIGVIFFFFFSGVYFSYWVASMSKGKSCGR